MEIQAGPRAFSQERKHDKVNAISLGRRGSFPFQIPHHSVIWLIFFLSFFFLEGIIKIKSKTNAILQIAGLLAL